MSDLRDKRPPWSPPPIVRLLVTLTCAGLSIYFAVGKGWPVFSIATLGLALVSFAQLERVNLVRLLRDLIVVRIDPPPMRGEFEPPREDRPDVDDDDDDESETSA